MDQKLYDMMDWRRIEGLVYSEEDNPHEFLGAHVTPEGVLIQAFIPTAEKIEVCLEPSHQKIQMDKEDETGFFAALLPGKKIPRYTLLVTFDNGTAQELQDPYIFPPQITKEETKKFNAGIDYEIYKKLGAHPMTVNGVKGVYFAVWAPNAVRVSLVGDFNLWDGRRHPMRRLWDSGIFEIFIPSLPVGTLYKYEIKAKGGLTYLKADPYANAAQLRPDTASVVTDLSTFTWTDQAWLEEHSVKNMEDQPVSVYEVWLGGWKKPADGREFYNYRELAPMLASYVKEAGYTHIELLPVMEHPLDESLGFEVTGYYAPTARYGTAQDFMFFMNYMHEQGIGVILDWVPSRFPRDNFGLAGFDGTCLYEHQDPRQGTNPHDGTLLYNYGRPEVKNFLISSALFWTEVYHADGIRLDSVSSMLYLDYGKNDGEWIANIYGGNENLDAIEFIKHLSSIFKKRNKGALLAAEEVTGWPKVTGDLNDEGLGFDMKWNTGWLSDFMGYMQLDPIFRGYHHGDLTFSMIYNYSEKYMLPLSHNEFTPEKGCMLNKLPGTREKKFANLRAFYGYFMTHPGKKLLFMGQDFASTADWRKGLDWDEKEEERNAKLFAYFKALQKLYRENPALYQKDFEPAGFEWINEISANENMLVFLRKTDKQGETLLVVMNFSPLVYADHKIGVPFYGKYKEIFNSDREEYGGANVVNSRMKTAKADECDERPYSIRITVPPMGITVFSCKPVDRKESENARAKAAKAKEARTKDAKAKVRSTVKAAPKKKATLKEELEEKYEKAEEENSIGKQKE